MVHMGTLINGKLIAEEILTSTAEDVKKLRVSGVTPHLGIILAGDNPASEVYVKRKQAAAERIGVRFTLFHFPSSVTQAELIKEMTKIQAKKGLSGLIVQLPLPEHLYTPEVLNAVKPELDVDCLTDSAIGRLAMNTTLIEPPTAGAIMTILRSLKIALPGKKVTIVGMGALVGKPLTLLLINARATVTTANSATKPLSAVTKKADIIVSGVGKAGLIRGSMIKRGAIVIDAGIAFDKKGAVVGDVHLPSVVQKAKSVTPTPGGVGPITVALLLKNTVTLCKNLKESKKIER